MTFQRLQASFRFFISLYFNGLQSGLMTYRMSEGQFRGSFLGEARLSVKASGTLFFTAIAQFSLTKFK
jgi:hypothetical protein